MNWTNSQPYAHIMVQKEYDRWHTDGMVMGICGSYTEASCHKSEISTCQHTFTYR